MRSLAVVLIAVLWMSLPASGADAPAAKDNAKELGEEMRQAATPLGSFYLAELPDRLWSGTKVNVVDRVKARQLIETEFRDHYKDQQWKVELSREEIWAPLYLVGLIPVDCDPRKAYLDWIYLNDAAVYDWDSKTLYVVKDEEMGDLPQLARKRIIMNEFAAALVQRHVFGGKSLHDLDRTGEMQHDNRLAITTIIEGSGRLLANRYQAEFTRTRKDSRSAVLQYADYEEVRSRQFMELPLYIQSSLGTTICGMHFLMRGKPASALAEGETGEEALLAIRKRLPQTTEQILHPEKFFNKEADDQPIIIDAGSVEKHLTMFTSATGGWKPVGAYKDTFGELLCSLLAKPKGGKANLAPLSPSYFINEAGTGWGGDKFFLLRKGDKIFAPEAGGPPPSVDKIKGVWVTVWDTPKDREEFVAAYSKNRPQADFVPVGARTAVFLYSMTPEERNSITELIQKNPPKLTQGKKNVEP